MTSAWIEDLLQGPPAMTKLGKALGDLKAEIDNPEEVRSWPEAAGLEIETLKLEDVGSTAIAWRPAAD